jgi:hypothetical protein
MAALGLDGWWDDPAYTQCDTVSLRAEFILAKLMQRDAEKFRAMMADLYRKLGPMPGHMTAFEWQTILAYMGATPAEIAEVLTRMGLSGQ